MPDWKPEYYRSEDVEVPYFVQDTPAARTEQAQEYTSINRLDQGECIVRLHCILLPGSSKR